MRRLLVLLLFAATCITTNAQNYSVNQNQQTVNINVPVIEKKVYVDRYRTVYVGVPSTRRIARKLGAPVQLHDYLWVYPEDLGEFKRQSDAYEIIKHINKNHQYGRNTWRIPTPGELALLEQNGDYIGLGDHIYLATNHANGVLRLVSTGPSVDEQNKENERLARMEQQRRIEIQRRIEDEKREARWIREEQIRKNDESIRQQILAQDKKERMNTEELKRQERSKEMKADLSQYVTLNGITWLNRNICSDGTWTSKVEGLGSYFSYDLAQSACPYGWRLPTSYEMEQLYSLPKKGDIVNGVEGTRFGVGENSIFFPMAGSFDFNGDYTASVGLYWSCSGSCRSAWYLNISPGYYGGVIGQGDFSGKNKHVRYSVRCVKN